MAKNQNTYEKCVREVHSNFVVGIQQQIGAAIAVNKAVVKGETSTRNIIKVSQGAVVECESNSRNQHEGRTAQGSPT